MFKCVIKNTIVFGYAMLFFVCELQLWPYSAYVFKDNVYEVLDNVGCSDDMYVKRLLKEPECAYMTLLVGVLVCGILSIVFNVMFTKMVVAVFVMLIGVINTHCNTITHIWNNNECLLHIVLGIGMLSCGFNSNSK